MNKTFTLITLLAFLAISFSLPANGEEFDYRDIDFSAGIRLSYNTAKVQLGPDKIENSLFYPFALLEIDVDVFDYFTVGLFGGYALTSFTNPVDFTELPLSLRLNEERQGAIAFGLNVQSEFYSFGYFSLKGKAEFLYFKALKNKNDIDLAVITGSAGIKHSFYQLSVNLLLQYDGLSGVTLFLGPDFNMLSGEISVNEVIEDIESTQTLDFNQKQFFGLMSGINIDIGSQLELILQACFFSKTTFSAGLFYIF